LPPTCEPDGEKVRRVKMVADKAVEELRDRRAKFECGELVDEQGAPDPVVEIEEDVLKQEVASKRSKKMGETEFEELWVAAIGEIRGREEVESKVDGYIVAEQSLSSVAALSHASPSSAPSSDPLDSQWNDIVSKLLS